jgi:hypothetical protein
MRKEGCGSSDRFRMLWIDLLNQGRVLESSESSSNFGDVLLFEKGSVGQVQEVQGRLDRFRKPRIGSESSELA